MLIFGHTGITLGAAVLLKNTLAIGYSLQPRVNKVVRHLESTSKMRSAQDDPSSGRTRWLAFLEKIDTRLLLAGSLLPDIIDKPVGTFFFRESLSSGRLFCHTLAFLLLITLAGFYLYRRHSRSWLLVLSFGTFTHLIGDQMWRELQTLLWPIYGWTFLKGDPSGLDHWLRNTLYGLPFDPAAYVPELVGMVILIWFVLVLVHQKKVSAFIKNGQVL